MLYDSIYVTLSRRQIYRDREQINDGQRLGVAKGLSVRDRMRSFWGVKNCFVSWL